MEELNKIKDEIAQKSKRNYLQEKEIDDLDKKIFVLIKSKMSIEEALATTGGSVSSLRTVTLQTEDPTERELYGQLFYLLQRDTVYVSLLTSQILLGEVDTLLQIVMFTLYGNQYQEDEEHLLLTVFRDVLSSEVANAVQPTVMFRSNTSLTRMLTTYTRRNPGLQFIKTAIGDWVTKIINNTELDLEVFPDKVRDKWIADYRAQQGLPPDNSGIVSEDGCIGGIPKDIVDEIIQGIIQPRIPCIEELIVELFQRLEDHLEEIPYGIRWICKQTKRLVAERWPDLPEDQQCSLVGGFFVLRYLNPAIITPAGYGIIPQDMVIPEYGRRNLTILAKIIQNLSNGVTFSTVKEAYMAMLNFILEKYQGRMIKFIGSICEVEDLDHHLKLDTYAGLTKLNSRNRTIRITPNEMHFVHDIIIRHRDTVFASLPPTDKIFDLLDRMPPPPAQKLPESENREVILQLVPPHAVNGENEAELSKIAPERLLSDAKYAMFLLIHKLPKTVLREVLEVEAGSSACGIQAFLKRAHEWGMEQDFEAQAKEFEEMMAKEGYGDEQQQEGDDDKKKKNRRKSRYRKSSSLKKKSGRTIRKKNPGQVVCELADRVLSVLKQLTMIGVLREEDDYAEFRAELSNVVSGIGAQIERLDRDIERLTGVSKSLDDNYKASQQVTASYSTYLTNVRQRASVFSLKKLATPAAISPSFRASGSPSPASSPVPSQGPNLESSPSVESDANEEKSEKKKKKEAKKEKEAKREEEEGEGEGEGEGKGEGKGDGEGGKADTAAAATTTTTTAAAAASPDEQTQKRTVVCTHGSLSWEKIIKTTNMNQKALSKTSYVFSSESPGIYNIQVVVDKKAVGSFDLFFEELLEKQLVGCQVISNEYGDFDVSNLIYFFNKKFNKT